MPDVQPVVPWVRVGKGPDGLPVGIQTGGAIYVIKNEMSLDVPSQRRLSGERRKAMPGPSAEAVVRNIVDLKRSLEHISHKPSNKQFGDARSSNTLTSTGRNRS